MTKPQSTGPRTLFERIWQTHAVVEREDGQTLLYIDRHLVHDGSGRAFEVLAERGLKMARPDRTFAVPDHYVPTTSSRTVDAAAHGFTLFDLGDVRQGIVHVMGSEQGISQPGMMIVCGDSHTSTHGAMGAYACGIGASQVSHVLATQTLWQRDPRALGRRPPDRLQHVDRGGGPRRVGRARRHDLSVSRRSPVCAQRRVVG